ncbi:hypothetical protein BK659_10795 [Pseudomonas brassicacearum]|uniref:Uncharacterized protein n=1 Tax=Pseudomonas brassicacearum TaxID=930166 RepID=A0A423H870_9PSED|nr:hypothetical protein [Pseudomonas brassicacearum]RON09408.1 hypothetical protein BK659_10795 [Pseudomonas brassicacearum]
MNPFITNPHTIKRPLQASTQEEDIKLIHDKRLETDFTSGRIEIIPSDGKWWAAKLTLKVKIAPAETIFNVDKEIITQNPEYHASSGFFSRHIFSHVAGYKLDKEDTESLLGGDTAEFARLTHIFIKRHAILDWFDTIFLQLEDSQFNATNNNINFTYFIYSLPTAGISKEEFIKSIQTELKWIPIRLGMGIEAPGLQTKIYSNGSDYFVNHTTLGRVPGGLYYLDLMNWDGQNQDFQLGHIKHTG